MFAYKGSLQAWAPLCVCVGVGVFETLLLAGPEELQYPMFLRNLAEQGHG